MKKIIAVITMVLLLCCPVTAFAAETKTDKVPDEQKIAVYGSVESKKNYYEIVIGVEDVDTVKLPSGVTISGKSDSKEDNGLRVIIIPVTVGEEAEAYAWLTVAAKDLGDDLTAYYLAFYRGNSPTQPQGTVTITVTEKEKTKLCYMDGNAVSKELPCSLNNDTMSFEMGQNGYYITVKSDSVPAPIIPDRPKTGDTSNIWVYFLVMSASAFLLVFLWRERKRLRMTLQVQSRE